MERRRIGTTEIEVAPLGFGGNVFGWTVDEALSFRLLDAFFAAGFNFIDTADVYRTGHRAIQGGESETIIGRWMKLRGTRDRMVIATKIGRQTKSGEKGLSRGNILAGVEGSLRRLQTDYIDLYQSHRDDPDTPFEETLAAYAHLIEQGKIRSIGVSNIGAARLSSALAVSRQFGYPPIKVCSRATISMTAPISKAISSFCAAITALRSFPIPRWPAVF